MWWFFSQSPTFANFSPTTLATLDVLLFDDDVHDADDEDDDDDSDDDDFVGVVPKNAERCPPRVRQALVDDLTAASVRDRNLCSFFRKTLMFYDQRRYEQLVRCGALDVGRAGYEGRALSLSVLHVVDSNAQSARTGPATAFGATSARMRVWIDDCVFYV